MNIGILTTRDASYHGNGRLLAAAEAEGHAGFLVHPALCRPCIAGNRPFVSYDGGKSLNLDVLLPRIGSTIDDFELSVARHWELSGVCLLNETAGVNIARDKYSTLQNLADAKIAVPDTTLITPSSDIPRVVRSLGGFPLVAKRRKGRKGRGVALVEDEGGLSEFLDTLEGPEAALLQKFIQSPDLRDLRILVIHGKAVAGMGRKPAQGDFRSNIGQSGQGYQTPLTEPEKRLAERAAGAVGLDVAGVDLLSTKDRPYILEVNYTPGVGGLEKVTGLDIARLIIQAASMKAERGEGGVNIGVWMDSPLHIKAETETTAFLMWSASARGHRLFVFDSHDFDGPGPRVHAFPVKPQKTDSIQPYWEYVKSCMALAPVSMDLTELDVVWYRKNPPLDRERVETLANNYPLPFTFNDFGGLLRAADKRSILDFPELTPKSIVVSDAAEMRACAADFTGKVVVKPLDGFGGWGIELHQAETLARVRANGPFPVMVQEYLPEVEREGDVRILTLGGEILGAMRRLPQAGDFRANVAQGGVVLKHDPHAPGTERVPDIGRTVSKTRPAFCRLGFRSGQTDRNKLCQSRRDSAYQPFERKRASRAGT